MSLYLDRSKLEVFLEVQDLLSHGIFRRLAVWSEYRVKHLEIDNPIKFRMTQEFINIYMEKIYTKVYSYITDRWYINGKSFSIYMNEIKADVIKTSISNGIPQLFIDKFTVAHTPAFEATLEGFDNISTTKALQSDMERAEANLDQLLFYITHLLMVTIATINNLNGELAAELRGSKFDINQ